MSAPAPTPVDPTLPAIRVPVRVSTTVVVGKDAKTFAIEGEAVGDSNPYRVARSLAYAMSQDAADYLGVRESVSTYPRES